MLSYVVFEQFYIVYVTDDHGKDIAEDSIVDQIRAIVEITKTDRSRKAVGVLTSLGRSEWHEARKYLLESNQNF